jgi:predicted metal-binding membrane protein
VGGVELVGAGPRSRPAAPPVRGQLAAIALLLALAGGAWALTDLRMAGMDGGPGTDPGAFGFYISTWVVMMAAMMLPSAGPMVLMHRRMQRSTGATSAFVAAYLLVWAASGLVAYGVLELGRSLAGGFFAWGHAGRATAAALLLAAAIYELTPLKNACLGRCRSPLAFVLGSWRHGRRGALAMGVEHGAWCLGCCWALMVALFALGAMSLTWMLVVAALIAAEKLLPWRTAATWGVAVALAVLAIGVAVSPAHIPGLTIPAGSGAIAPMGSAMH